MESFNHHLKWSKHSNVQDIDDDDDDDDISSSASSSSSSTWLLSRQNKNNKKNSKTWYINTPIEVWDEEANNEM